MLSKIYDIEYVNFNFEFNSINYNYNILLNNLK